MSDTPNRLIAKRDLVGLDDDQALELIGKLTDLSGDLRRTEGLEQAVRLSEELQQRDLSADHRAISHYFLGNVWANSRALAGEDQGEWEQPELEHEIFHHRMALRDEASPGLTSERVCQMLTNLGNAMSALGRPVEAIQYWDRVLQRLPRFSMARGNRGYSLSYYAAAVHDDGHQAVMLKSAHSDLQRALSPELRQYLEGNAYEGFERVKSNLEGYLTAGYIAEDSNLDDFPLCDSEEEVAYRRWCLRERLFLNPLNDLGPYAIAAHDALMLPPVVPLRRSAYARPDRTPRPFGASSRQEGKGFDRHRAPRGAAGIRRGRLPGPLPRGAGRDGTYFVGLPFQHTFASAVVGGVGRDARHHLGCPA